MEIKFKNYPDFCEWVYSVKVSGNYPRLGLKGKFEILSDNLIYSSVMEVLHAHEEGGPDEFDLMASEGNPDNWKTAKDPILGEIKYRNFR